MVVTAKAPRVEPTEVSKVKFRALMLLSLPLLVGCNFQTNEERAIQQMVADYLVAVQSNDESTAYGIVLDLAGFRALNPDVSARLDASAFTDAVLSDLITNFRQMVSYFGGKELKLKSLQLGPQWYQYKGFPAFKDNSVVLIADGQRVEMTIRGIVRIDGRWRIVDLNDNGLF